MGVVRVEIPIGQEAAIRLADPNRLEAVGRLVSHILRPTAEHIPLAILLEATGPAAEQAGLTREDIDQELAACKTERAARLIVTDTLPDRRRC
jgi:precorrin-4 methylase